MLTDQFIQLKRAVPRKKQAIQSGLIGGVLLLGGSIILYIAFSSLERESFSESWVTFLVGGVFTLFGLLLAFAAIKQSHANLLPETIVGIDHLPIHPGETVRIGICQPGPVRITSISANLVCEVITRQEVRNPKTGGEHWRYISSFPCQQNIVRTGPSDVSSGGTFDYATEFTVPEKSAPTSDQSERQVIWRIEVWGKVKGAADFMHPYTIEVARK
jgi:hypothetical protein